MILTLCEVVEGQITQGIKIPLMNVCSSGLFLLSLLWDPQEQVSQSLSAELPTQSGLPGRLTRRDGSSIQEKWLTPSDLELALKISEEGEVLEEESDIEPEG